MASPGRVRQGKLLERRDPLASLRRLARAAATGEGSLVALRGGTGLGKTRLLEELAHRLERDGSRVLTARGTQLERDFGFGVTRQLFDPLVAEASPAERRRMFAGAAALAEPLFGGGEAVSDPTGFAVLNGLWWLLSTAASARPLALLVDDVHWADIPSVHWLAFLAPRISEVPVLVVAAGRTDEPGAPVEWGALSATESTLELAPLSVEAATELLANRLGVKPAEEFAAACHIATGGNPFLLTELARELDARGISPTQEEAIAVGKMAPDRVAELVVGRLDAQPAEVGRLARCLAVLGDGAPLLHAAELAQLDEPAAREAAASLVDLGILRGDQLTFEHPIVREAVYESVVPVLRADMHRRAADVLDRRGQPAERCAAHLLVAEAAGDPKVVSVLREAAAAADARGAIDAAADYLTRALEEPPAARERAMVLTELGHAELQCGRPNAADHLRHAAAIATDRRLTSRATADLVSVLMLHGQLDAAVAAADERRSMPDHGGDLAVETELMAAATIAGAPAWAKLSGRLRSLKEEALGAGDRGRALLAPLAFDEIRRGGTAAATGKLARAALANDVLLSRGADYPPFVQAVYAAIRGGEGNLAIEVLDRAIERSRERRSLLGFGFASCYRGMAFFLRSELDAAEADLRGALEAGRDNGWQLLEWAALGLYLILLAERGDLEEGQAELAAAGLESKLPHNPIATNVLSGRATLRYAQGRWREAYEDFVECGRHEAPYSERSQIVWWRPDAAMALAHLGESAEALELAEAELEMAREWGDPINIGRALHARGLAKGEDGIADLEAAAQTLSGAYDLGLCSCLVDLGAAMRRAGRRSDAREPLRQGLEIAERIGAHRHAERARAELAACGARARSVMRVGVDSLTPSELRVCMLAASGLSNPEIAQELFVTRKTVEKHLASAFLKLEISSRGELPEILSKDASGTASVSAEP